MVHVEKNRTHPTCACCVVSTLPSSSARKPRNPSAWGAVPSRLGRRWREDIRAIRVTLCSPVARSQPVGTPYSLQGPVFTGAGLVEGPNIDLWGTVSPASRVCRESRHTDRGTTPPLRKCCRCFTFFPFTPPFLYFGKIYDLTHPGIVYFGKF